MDSATIKLRISMLALQKNDTFSFGNYHVGTHKSPSFRSKIPLCKHLNQNKITFDRTKKGLQGRRRQF
jgi:hypothetical protein